MFPRAAEDLLSQIQENYQKPQEELAVLKEAVSSLLSAHSSDLMRAAERAPERSRDEDPGERSLLLLIGANLREFCAWVLPALAPLELVPDSPM